MIFNNRNVKVVGMKQSKSVEDLNKIFADFPPQDMTNHSVLTNETLANTLKSPFSDLSIQKETILSTLMYILIFSQN